MLPNISRSKDNYTMTFGQLFGYNKINIFLQTSCTKLGKETSSRPLFEVKANGLQLSFNYSESP